MMTNVFNISLAIYLAALVAAAIGLFVKHRSLQIEYGILINSKIMETLEYLYLFPTEWSAPI